MIGTKRLLLLLSPLAIVSCALGAAVETVEIDPMARQLQGATTVPKGGPKQAPVPSSDDSGKGKGKGSSSSDSSKSSKSQGGKGDVPKSTSSPSPPGGKGKGDKSSKSSKKGSPKMTKSAKSAKSAKSPKSKKDGGVSPGTPTSPPIVVAPTTPSPTSVNSIPRRATPYALFYTLSNERIPTTEEYAQLAEVTRVYLEEFMIEEFAQTSLTNLDDFLTFMIRNSFTFGQPVQADYRSTGLFNPSSIFLPTVRELDELITTAFTDENLANYLARVRSLPSGNVFSGTTSISKGLPEVPIPRNSGSTTAGSANMFTAGLASTAAGIVVLAAGLVLLRRQKESDEEEFGENNNKKGDVTVAGETCNMSLDGSSVAPWRRSANFTGNDDDDNDELDEDEFEDEPLDDDDDAVSMRHSTMKSVAT